VGTFSTAARLNEPLLERVRQRGKIASEDSRHLQEIIAVAEDIGAQVVLVTCSTISPCVDVVRASVGIPINKIDEAMIAKAVQEGTKIGVIATNSDNAEPYSAIAASRSRQSRSTA